MIQGIVIAAYIGWIAFGATSILLPQTSSGTPGGLPFHVAATSVLVGFWALFAKQRSPWTFYVYIVFPFPEFEQLTESEQGSTLQEEFCNDAARAEAVH